MTEQETIQTHLKALTIFDANNTMMSVEEYAEFAGVCYKTAITRVHNKKIISIKNGSTYEIPKMQFLKELIERFENDF